MREDKGSMSSEWEIHGTTQDVILDTNNITIYHDILQYNHDICEG